jgi:hypothetical protein
MLSVRGIYTGNAELSCRGVLPGHAGMMGQCNGQPQRLLGPLYL